MCFPLLLSSLSRKGKIFLEEGSLSSFARGSARRFLNQFANFCRRCRKKFTRGGVLDSVEEKKKKRKKEILLLLRALHGNDVSRETREKRGGEINIHCSLKNSFQFFSLRKRISYLFIFSFFFFPSLFKMQNVRAM